MEVTPQSFFSNSLNTAKIAFVYSSHGFLPTIVFRIQDAAIHAFNRLARVKADT